MRIIAHYLTVSISIISSTRLSVELAVKSFLLGNLNASVPSAMRSTFTSRPLRAAIFTTCCHRRRPNLFATHIKLMV